MEMKRDNHTIQFLFPIIVFFVFAISAVTVLLLASNSYAGTAESSAISHNARTTLSYVTEKIHQSDEVGAVYVQELDDMDVLVLDQEIDEQLYHTFIYPYDGSLHELFVSDSTLASADALSSSGMLSSGNTITQVNDFQVDVFKENLLLFHITDSDGNTSNAVISLQSGE